MASRSPSSSRHELFCDFLALAFLSGHMELSSISIITIFLLIRTMLGLADVTRMETGTVEGFSDVRFPGDQHNEHLHLLERISQMRRFSKEHYHVSK